MIAVTAINWDLAVAALATLLVTVDPPGLVPIFLSLTQGMSSAQRRHVAILATAVATAILISAAFGGQAFLGLLGISLPAFRVAGGLLLFWIAFEMLFGTRHERKQQSAEQAITADHIRNIAAFPLAIPLIAGPGSIAAVILLAAQSEGDVVATGILLATIAAVMVLTLLSFFVAQGIDRILGQMGRTVLSRLLGIILAALAVQFVADGVRALAAAS